MKRANAIIATAILACNLAHAQGDDSGASDARVDFRIGAQLFADFSTVLRIDSERFGFGTEIELEEDLAIEDAIQVGRLDATFRFNKRHGIAMSFYDIERDGTRLTDKDIGFGETFYPEGTPVQSEFNERIIKAAYRYRFLSKQKAEMSGSFGLHTMQIETALRALDGSLVQEQEADAPLPVFGIHGAYRFGAKWRFTGSVEWFDVQVGDFQGTFLDALIAVEHDTFENVGFGFGFNRFSLDVEAGNSNLRGLLDITFDAGIVYFTGSFGSID